MPLVPGSVLLLRVFSGVSSAILIHSSVSRSSGSA
jgi:hypothetical protein